MPGVYQNRSDVFFLDTLDAESCRSGPATLLPESPVLSIEITLKIWARKCQFSLGHEELPLSQGCFDLGWDPRKISRRQMSQCKRMEKHILEKLRT